MKKLYPLIAILVLLLLIILWVFFFPKKDTTTNPNLAFPESVGTVTRPPGNQGIPASEGEINVIRDTRYFPSLVPARPAQAHQARSQTSSGVSYEGPSYATFTVPPEARLSPNFTLRMNQPVQPLVITQIPTSPPAPSKPSVFTPPPPTGPQVIGVSRAGDTVTFNALTGDLYVGDTHFNFTGMSGIPDGGTSDTVGDVDNLAVGNAIGLFVGSLIGDPGLGLLFGNALGSNLINGFKLQDFGIGMQNGLPTFGGESPLDLFGLGSGGGFGSAAGGGLGVFGGTLTILSVCNVGTLYFVTGTPYSGPLMWMPGISGTPPYLYSLGSPPIEGYAIGHYQGGAVCVVGEAPVGEGPVMYGYGTGSI